MYRHLLIISIVLLLLKLNAQENGDDIGATTLKSDPAAFLPNFNMPLPDSANRAVAVKFYEGRIENLNGQNSSRDQAIILFCLAELKRLDSLYVDALYALLETWKTARGNLTRQDSILVMSRICFNSLSLIQEKKNVAVISEVSQQLGYPNYETVMLTCIEGLEEEKDDINLPAMLNVAFQYYKTVNMPQKAYIYGEKLIRYKDYLAAKQLKNKLSALKMDYQVTQKEGEIALLNNQKIIYEERIKAASRKQWAIIGGIGVLLIFVLALWYRVRDMVKTKILLQAKAAQLQHEKNRAEKSELFKEQFLANVSHEIRTPMNAIMGITNILIEKKHPKTQDKYLTAMHESAKNLLGLINDILDLSKLEAGKVELVTAPFSPREIISTIQASLKQKANDKGLSFSAEIDDRIPQSISGDGFVLRNILVSLIENAISFTNTGGVSLKCNLAREENDVATMQFFVQDTGLGIVPEKQDKILTTFVKVYEKSSIKYEGSGLELAIINQMVELQGGTIRLESEPNVGTTFIIEIPYSISSDANSLPENAKSEEPGNELKDISVLLVEDNEFNVMVATSVLESVIEGLQIDLAENGKIAVDKINQNHYDLVLMDVQMPVMDGYEATRMIRKIKGETGEIPIIAMTANVLPQEIEKCIQEGMDDYVSKPFDTNELLDKMKRLLANSLEVG